jgi:elongation factor Ts
MTVSTEMIKELREATGVGILECRNALETAGGDFDKAVAVLREKGLAKAARRAGREASEGVVELYSHGDGRVGVMVEVNCETDFVARSEMFRELAHEIALQIAAASPLYVTEDEIPEKELAVERDIASKRAADEGKPENIIPRIVDGRVEKYKDQVVLMRQPYIRDESLTVEALVKEKIGSLGENLVVRRFERWELGEDTGNGEEE